MFDALSSKLQNAFKNLRGSTLAGQATWPLPVRMVVVFLLHEQR
jgi:hypothetical protein